MAMSKCASCGKESASYLDRCPHCRQPRKAAAPAEPLAVGAVKVDDAGIGWFGDEAPSAAPAIQSAPNPGDISNGHVLGTDNQWHPLAAAAQQEEPTATRSSDGGTNWSPLGIALAIAVAVGVLVFATVGGGIIGASTGDVSLGQAYVKSGSVVYVPVSITNTGGGVADYWVSLAAVSQDGSVQYDTALAPFNDVQPGQTAQGEANFTGGVDEIPFDAVFTVTELRRF